MSVGTISPKRKLGSITADITISETHDDQLAITQHPVEKGASVTDHAYKQPAVLTLRLGWSNASQEAGGNSQYVRDIYAKLLALQASRIPFDVVTGKRSYSNMLMRSVGLTTDQTTEYALFVTVVCQQIIIVSTTTTTIPDSSVQADPAKTGAVVNNGTQQAKLSGTAALLRFTDPFGPP